jgi:hypothetical protein
MKITRISKTSSRTGRDQIVREWKKLPKELKIAPPATHAATIPSTIAENQNKPAWRGHHMDIWI